MNKVRVDKWLWSVRIYKSRTLAANACKASKVSINDHNAKPAAEIQEGDTIAVKKGGFTFSFKVLKLIDKRVGAPLAVLCYNNVTPEDELNKYKSWFIGKAQAEVRERGSGRPTKKERRNIDEFKDQSYFEMDWED